LKEKEDEDSREPKDDEIERWKKYFTSITSSLNSNKFSHRAVVVILLLMGFSFIVHVSLTRAYQVDDEHRLGDRTSKPVSSYDDFQRQIKMLKEEQAKHEQQINYILSRFEGAPGNAPEKVGVKEMGGSFKEKKSEPQGIHVGGLIQPEILRESGGNSGK